MARIFDTIKPASRSAILFALPTASSPKTRQRRMNKVLAMLADKKVLPRA